MALIFKTFDAVKKLFSSFYYNTFYMIRVIKGKKNSWLCYFYSVLLFMLKNNTAVFTYTCRKILVQDTLVLLKNLRNRIHIQWENKIFLYEKDPTKSYPCLLLCMSTSTPIQAYRIKFQVTWFPLWIIWSWSNKSPRSTCRNSKSELQDWECYDSVCHYNSARNIFVCKW